MTRNSGEGSKIKQDEFIIKTEEVCPVKTGHGKQKWTFKENKDVS